MQGAVGEMCPKYLVFSVIGEEVPDQVGGVEDEKVDAPAVVVWIAQVPCVEVIGCKAASAHVVQE